MALGGEPRARRGLRLGHGLRGLLPRDRARAALALLPGPGAAAGGIRADPGRLAGAGRVPPAAEPLRLPTGAARDPAALGHVHVLLRHAHAGRVLVPAPAAPVGWALRGGRLDGRL